MTGPKLNEAPVQMRQGKRRGPAGQSTMARGRWVRISAWKVREVVDLILHAHGSWDAATAAYLKE